MKRVLVCVFAAAAVALVAGETAQADGPKKKVHLTAVNRVAVVRSTQGVRSARGVFYQANQSRQFRYRCWSNNYRCWMFFDPTTGCWFYWSARNGRFMPMSYAATMAPNGVPPLGTNALPNPFSQGQFPQGQLPTQGQGQLPPDQLPTTPDQQQPDQQQTALRRR